MGGGVRIWRNNSNLSACCLLPAEEEEAGLGGKFWSNLCIWSRLHLVFPLFAQTSKRIIKKKLPFRGIKFWPSCFFTIFVLPISFLALRTTHKSPKTHHLTRRIFRNVSSSRILLLFLPLSLRSPKKTFLHIFHPTNLFPPLFSSRLRPTKKEGGGCKKWTLISPSFSPSLSCHNSKRVLAVSTLLSLHLIRKF